MPYSKSKMYKSLRDIKSDKLIKEIINEIMEEIKRHELIYQNEEQLQFDLAWRINERLDKSSGIRVLFEVFSMLDSSIFNPKSTRKKVFTDLILLDKSNNYIPIELKYKKLGMKTIINGNAFEIGHDGASDLGRFDYLWDIHRIEQFKTSTAVVIKDTRLGSFVCGYAIMITNDDSYWEKKKGCCADNMTLNKEISKIRWCATCAKSCKSIVSGVNTGKYFDVLLPDPNPTSILPIEKKYMPLHQKYDFSKGSTNIITASNYKCQIWNPDKKVYKPQQEIEIKAFIAEIN